ncbi:MAG TPA: hypothetical protein VIU41_04955 [Geobacteraceae bacterium]
MVRRLSKKSWLLVLLTMLLVWPADGNAQIKGEASLGYVSYNAEDHTGTLVDASSLAQRYSLMYVTQGDVKHESVGTYKLGVGYQWLSLSASATSPQFGNQNSDISAGRALYDGEIWLDPPQLPLKFKAYLRDPGATSFNVDSLPPLNSSNTLLTPGVITDINDSGTNINGGFTLTFGVKDSMTSSYSSLFSLIPMVMIDYRDTYQHDTNAQNRIDLRSRRLSFISLNKADNWFHYRAARFDNYLDRTQSFTEDEFQLGTIDFRLRRTWIEMTNWIKISTDGRLTSHKGESATTSFEEYDLNFFGIASRRNWEARTFLNFNRHLEQNQLILSQRAPFYLNGVLSADTDWFARYVFDADQRQYNVGPNGKRTNNTVTVGVNTFRRAPFTLSSTFSMEMAKDTASSDNIAFGGTIETASTRRFSDVLGLQARYNTRLFLSTDNKSGNESTYLTQELAVMGKYTPNQRLTVSLTQQIQAGSGTNPVANSNSTITTPSLGTSGNFVLTQRAQTINDYLRFNTLVEAGWRQNANFSTFVTASADVLTTPGQQNDIILMATHGLNYETPIYSMNLNTTAISRDTSGRNVYNVVSFARASYRPNRDLDSSASIEYRWLSDNSLNGTWLQVLQRLNYVFWNKMGIRAKLIELTEDFNYTLNEQNSVTLQDSTTVRFTGRYYPTSRLTLMAAAAGTVDQGAFTQAYTAGIIASFKLLEASADYSYAMRDSDKRIDKRLSATVQRRF